MVSKSRWVEPTTVAPRAPQAIGTRVFLLLLVLGLLGLCDGVWRRGEVFSPADAVFTLFPWADATTRVAPSNLSRTDEAFYHQPLVITHWARLKRGDFPEWDPLSLGGVPAFFQGLDVGRALSPLSLPFYVAPADIAATLYAPLRLALGGWFMWLFLRRRGLSPLAAATGGLAFAFNGAFIVWLSAPMPTVALFLPLVLYAIDGCIERGRPRDLGILALAVGGMLLGAYLPTSIVVLAVAGLYSVWRLTERRAWRRAVAIGSGTALGFVIGAGALLPMLANLTSSAARERSFVGATLPWSNLVTLVVPNFFGSPVTANWWHPHPTHYPELVTYLGVVTVVLAGIGVVAGSRERLFALALAVFSLAWIYGVPPIHWLASLPGLAQMNPLRWNVALAFAVAVAAACGIEAVGDTRSRRGTMVAAAGTAGVLLALSIGAAMVHLPAIRALSLQTFERAQLQHFAVLLFITVGLVALAVAAPRPQTRRLARAALVVLALFDLVSMGRGFNPTMARDRLYPMTPGLEQLQAQTAGTRMLPIEEGDRFVQGNVWHVFGVPTLSGFDYHGDPEYQALFARATGQPVRPPTWGYVGTARGDALDFKLLGLLNVGIVVAPPVDVEPRGRGYDTIGDLTDGLVVRQEFVARFGGLRRVDLLTATHGRTNDGTWDITVIDAETATPLVHRTVPVADLPNNDWLRLDLPAVGASRGRRFAIEVRGHGAAPGRAATLWGTTDDAYPEGTLAVGPTALTRDLWFRTFSSAPDRWPGVPLVWSGDLNIYRNPFALPQAWFVTSVESVPVPDQRVSLQRADLNPLETAVHDGPRTRTAIGARVVQFTRDTPEIVSIQVDAAQGGFLVVNERFHGGWQATIDGRRAPVERVDAVLMGLAVPPGARDIRLTFRLPGLRPGVSVSLAGLVLVALLMRSAVSRKP